VRSLWLPELTARTIGGRLLRAFLLLALLLGTAGVIAYTSLHSAAETSADALEVIRSDARFSSQLSAAVAEEIQAARRYLRDGDQAAGERFRALIVETHGITRDMTAQSAREREHVALVAQVDRALSAVAATYVQAHRLRDLGDVEAARREDAGVNVAVSQLLGAIDRLGAMTERQVTLVAAEMRRDAEMRALAILVVFGGVMVLGTLLVGDTLRAINTPLRHLVDHADALSRGAFEVRTTTSMPGEFERIASALNEAGTSLGLLADATAATASELSSSSSELSQVSDRIAQKATEVSHVMENVTRGAENQVGMLTKIDAELAVHGQRAVEVRHEAGSVAALAESIEREAIEKRQTIARAVAVLEEIRTSVQEASRTAESLHGATEGIAQFVTTVGRIAEQTNLLALNAAIEAARAGDAGRGFVVVADEVRKLAEAAQRAADDVARLTRAITGGVNQTVGTMQRSAGLVGEIETVGRDVGMALESITASAGRTVAAAANLSQIAAQNSTQMAGVQQSLGVVAADAIGHATSAQQASASSHEQSAACQQMSAASQVLHGRSTRLRALVESRGARGTTPAATPVEHLRQDWRTTPLGTRSIHTPTRYFTPVCALPAVAPRPATALPPGQQGTGPESAPPVRLMVITPLNNRVLDRAPRPRPPGPRRPE